ncbi:MAG: hypothetical protein ABI286_10850 [Edaphobacter sp.]
MSESNKNRCVVLLPFGPHFERLYNEVLESAITEAGLIPFRHRQNARLPTPINIFVDEIEQAGALFAEISENIPEIWLAIGCAISLGIPVCLISSSLQSSMPLGVQYLPLIHYPADSFPSDHLQLQQNILAQLSAILPRPEIPAQAPTHSTSSAPSTPDPAPSEELASYEVLALTILDLNASRNGLSPRELALEMRSRNSAHLTSHAMNALRRRGFVERKQVQINEGNEQHISENLFLTHLGDEWLVRHDRKTSMHRSTSRIRALMRSSKTI